MLAVRKCWFHRKPLSDEKFINLVPTMKTLCNYVSWHPLRRRKRPSVAPWNKCVAVIPPSAKNPALNGDCRLRGLTHYLPDKSLNHHMTASKHSNKLVSPGSKKACPLGCLCGRLNMIKCPLKCSSRRENMMQGPLGCRFSGENVIKCPSSGENTMAALTGALKMEKKWCHRLIYMIEKGLEMFYMMTFCTSVPYCMPLFF